jgi:hypothetical protein
MSRTDCILEPAAPPDFDTIYIGIAVAVVVRVDEHIKCDILQLTSLSVKDLTISRNAACSSVGLNSFVNVDPLASSDHDGCTADEKVLVL